MTFHPRFLKGLYTPPAARIEINVTSRLLSLYLGDTPFGVYPVGVGKPTTPSPLGLWQIREKIINPSWEVLGARWMGLDVPWGNYGLHGTNAPWSIGQYVSNGCIRMYNADVEKIFDLVYIGTPVHIYASNSQYRTLTPGSVGYEVALLQQKLEQLGFYRGNLDGIYGPATEGAVRSFQRAFGLAVDGIAGPATWEKLLAMTRP